MDHIDPLLTTVISIFAAVMASSGFWAFLQRKTDKNDAATKLALGLAHNEIVSQGLAFIERGYIMKDEYDDFVKYLYAPYATFGGNGLAQRIFEQVSDLPIRRYAEVEPEKAVRKYVIPGDKNGTR